MAEPKDSRQIAEKFREVFPDLCPDSVTMQFQFGPNGKSAKTPNDQPKPDLSHPPQGRISHSPDFASIRWVDGQTYPFTPRQRPVVAMLWQAMEDGTYFVGSGALLEAAEVNADRLRDLFRGNRAWGTVIVQGLMHGGTAGTYRIAPLDGAEDGAV